jgi:hypothetical protein
MRPFHIKATKTSPHCAAHTESPVGTDDIRSHPINERGWRGERFWPAARRDAGRIPAAGCNRGTTTQPAKRSTALDLFSEHMYPPSDKFKVPNAAAGIYEMASSQTKIISLAAGPRSAGARVCDPQQAGA